MVVNINPNYLPVYLRLKRINNRHYILFNKAICLDLKFELVFLYFHSFNIILVPQKHDLSTLINSLK